MGAGSYAAFCRNFGYHSTRVAGTHNWNEEAIQPMVNTLSPQWRTMCAQIEQQRCSVTGALEDLCEEAIDILGESYRALSQNRDANWPQSRKISSMMTNLTPW